MRHTTPEIYSRERIPMWDAAKCILIFCVILGHYLQTLVFHGDAALWNNAVFKGIYMFHMPLFALISGYFAAASIDRYHRAALLRYAVRVGIPNAFFCLIGLVVWHKGHTLWFLDFILESVVFYYLFTLCRNRYIRVAVLGLPLILLATLRVVDRLYLFPCVTHFTYLYPIFLLGCLMQRKGWGEGAFPKYMLAALPLFLMLIPLFPGEWLVYKTPFRFTPYAIGVDVVRTAVALVGCCACLTCCRYLVAFSRNRCVLAVGKATLALYLLQSLFLERSPNIWQWLPAVDSLYLSPLYALLILCLLYAVYWLSRRLPYVGPLMYGEI